MVRSGQSFEKIFNLMGSLTIWPPLPATSSVSFSIFKRTSPKLL